MDSLMGMDGYDQELLASFQALGPLLRQASEYKRTNEDERQSKRHKQEGLTPLKQEDQEPAKEAVGVLKLLTHLVLNHERTLQQLAKQDSFVMFISNSAQGALPLLATLAGEWKKALTEKSEMPPKQTLRTFLFQGLIKELNQRVHKLSGSKQGEMLWDTAIQKGTLRADGSWPYQRWNPQTQQLEESPRPPLSMTRLQKELQYLEELLEDSTHVMRFHSLKPQKDMTPWQLQVSFRDSELWRTLMQLVQSKVWILLGIQMKAHSLSLSRPAQNLQTMMGKGNQPQKGQGKGKKGKSLK